MTIEIEKFLKQCQKNLIDTTGRNNLINFKFNAKTCLDIDRIRHQTSKDQSFEISKIENVNEFNLLPFSSIARVTRWPSNCKIPSP